MEAPKDVDHLDLEYLQILKIIKPHITCIMDNRYIELIKSWLEKLSSEGHDKVNRNRYLVSLGKQIEQGVMQEPFLKDPPEGPLKPFAALNFQTYHTPGFQASPPKIPRQRLKGKSRRGRKRHEEYNHKSWKKEFERGVESDSSWFDITDEHVIEMASGDAPMPNAYEIKIQQLMQVNDKLRVENATLNEVIENYKKDTQPGHMQNIVEEVEMLKNKLYDGQEWQSTISSLHRKLTIMQKKNFQLKNVINDLENRLNQVENNTATPQKCVILSEMHKKETELLKQMHEKDLEKVEASYKQALNEKSLEYKNNYESQRKCYEARVAEAQSEVRDYYEKQVDNIRKEFQRDIKSYCDEKKREFEEMEERHKNFNHNCYEEQVEEIRSEFQREIKFKDTEISRLENLLQEQCGRMQEEVQRIRDQLTCCSNDEGANEKILFLQKCILKMDKLYKRAEKEFVKQLAKVRREMDLKDKQNQILLTTQRVNIISSNSATKQKEIDDIVTKLEQHYKSMLIAQHNEAMKGKNTDEETISELREQLSHIKSCH